jgi:hypothetical protein
MKLKSLSGIGILLLPALARAVYAPIPEQEQGKAFVVTVEAGVYHDSNIFGASTGAISSMVYSIAPKLSFNASVDPQTFVSASYMPTLDYFDNRPTDNLLLSHEVALRLAHAFTDVTNVDLSESFQVEKNPQSLMSGFPINADQSFTRNELDGRFTTALGPKTGLVFKYRNTYYDYYAAMLGRSLDRMEHLGGVEVNNKLLPEATVIGEYRHQVIDYRNDGGTKDKVSDFLLAGLDYSLGKKVTLSGRAGLEDRRRSGGQDTNAPYAEAMFRFNYSEQSFVSGGYVYSLEETDNPERFTDSKTHRIFVNVQHALTAAIIASASATVEPATLRGIRGLPDIRETTTRLGAAVTYVLRRDVTLSATYDYDNVASDLPGRDQVRSRVGVNARLYF